MIKKKIDKETAIKLILDKKKKGVDEKSILKYFLDNFSFTEPTFYNWKKEALIRFALFEAKVNPIIEAKEIEAKGELAKAGILSKLERQLILSQIASGEVRQWKEISTKEGIQKAEYTDQIRAIAELNKMDGSYISEIESEDNITEIKITRINGN